jgi:hypothetical protein
MTSKGAGEMTVMYKERPRWTGKLALDEAGALNILLRLIGA